MCRELTWKGSRKKVLQKDEKMKKASEKRRLAFSLLLEEIIEMCPGRCRRQFAKSGKGSEETAGIVALRFTAGSISTC